MAKSRLFGFTLAELLIALAILGVIATFSIPKILRVQEEQRYRAMGKEVAAMLSQSIDLHKLNVGITSATTTSALTPYMNYIAVDTSSLVNWHYGWNTTRDCSSVGCLRLHNGAILHYDATLNFGGTATTNAVYFWFDPDGKVTEAGAS